MTLAPLKIVRCDGSRHSSQILEVLNDAILNSTAIFDYRPRAPESMGPWFEAKAKGEFPVIGVESEDGQLLGFASYGTFRAWPAYKYTIEHSIYIHRDHRGKGLGRLLLGELIAAAQTQGYHVMVGGIEATNAGSIALHESLGFVPCGTIRQAGYKFGRWLDLSFYQLTLPTPANPLEE